MKAADDTTEQAEKKRKREELILALFLLLLSDTRHTLTHSCAAYLAGTLAFGDLSDALAVTLTDAHAHAAYLGRRFAGARGPFGAADRQFGASVMYGQATYLTGLLHALETGRYADATERLAGRLLLYVLRLRGTALEAYARALPPDTLVERRLGLAVEHHCEDCPPLVGVYRADEMTQFPGDGSTRCGNRCDCRLFVGGVEAFPFPMGEDLT